MRPALRSAAARLLVGYAALLALSFPLGRAYGSLLLPVFRAEIEAVAPEFRVLSLGLPGGGEASFELKVEVARPYGPHGERLPLGARMTCTTLLGHAVQHPLVLLPLVFAWPATSTRKRALRLAACLPFLFAVELLDVPLVLLGSAQDILVANFGPKGWPFHRLIPWMNFLNGGGRLALSAAAAVLSVASCRVLEPLGTDGARRVPSGARRP